MANALDGRRRRLNDRRDRCNRLRDNRRALGERIVGDCEHDVIRRRRIRRRYRR
jgi:hypothetical protein